jgi:hypothetical protein
MSRKTLRAVTVLGTSLLFAARQRDETFGKNGRFWSFLQAGERSVFLVGILNGWQLRSTTEAVVKGGDYQRIHGWRNIHDI